MIFKDEICMWFKNNESHHRLELICGLLNMCVPLELRFIRTCVDDLGKRDDMLRDYDSKANCSDEFSQLGEVLDERTRSKLVVYIALLEANNQTCSKLLFEKLVSSKDLSPMAFSDNDKSNINHIKEMLLIYTMVLHHPAFTFEEKRVIGERFRTLENQNEKLWHLKKTQFDLNRCGQDGLALDTCHPISSGQPYEACDSGLSIETEPEGELLSDHVCTPVVIQTSPDTRIRSVDNPSFESFNGSSAEELEGQCNNMQAIPNPSILRCSRNPNTPGSIIRPKSSTTVSTSTVNGPKGCAQTCPCPVNREASSSGSGESLNMYGESVSVPTTYIYNSNIYEQNITEMPAMALSNNLMNMTPGYMCHHNGNCHFYRYPLINNSIPSVPVPRKSPGTPSETSSSEEGGTTLVTSKQQRVSLNSPSSSPQSSPYASPPQSLSPIRAASPRENKLSSNFQSASVSCVTGTTTSVVVSRSSPRPPSRQGSTSSSGNGSQPSSPAIVSNSQTYRNKPIITSKSSRYVSERSNSRRGGLQPTQDYTVNHQVLENSMLLNPTNSVGSSYSNVTLSNQKEDSKTLGGTPKIDTNHSSNSIDTNILKNTSIAAVITNSVLQNGISKTSTTLKCEYAKLNESGLDEKPNDQINACQTNIFSKKDSDDISASNLTNGCNGSISRLPTHSVPVMASVPSGSGAHKHNSIPDPIVGAKNDTVRPNTIYNTQSPGNELSFQGNLKGNAVDAKIECDLQISNGTANLFKSKTVECAVPIITTSLETISSVSSVVVLSSQSSNIHSSGNNVVANNTKLTKSQVSCPISSPAVSQSPMVSSGNKTTGNSSSYTTTTTNSTASMVPVVAPHGAYQPYFSIPMIPGTNAPYPMPGGFFHHPGAVRPSQAFFVTPSSMVHGHPSHFMKGGRSPHMLPPPSNFNGGNIKARVNGCVRSGSSSSSSSSLGRKKNLSRGVPFPNKSLSSDSSPSSSQYSSPPQTPSPDHTKDARRKPGKPNDVYAPEEVWDQTDSKGLYMSNGPNDDGPSMPPMNHVMMPSNSIRQRYFPFPHPMSYVSYPPPHPGIFRYSLTSPMMMGPRPPNPLNSDKSSRETTPPSHPLIGGAEVSQKSIDYSNTVSTVQSSIPYSSSALVSSNSSGTSSSPPIVPAPNIDMPPVALVPPPGSAVHSCTQNSPLQYNNPPNYPMFAMSSGQYVPQLPGLYSSPNSALPNGYGTPHGLPPNFPPMSNVINSEMMYSNQYPVMGQTTPSISSCSGHPVMHSSNGPVFTSLYQTPPPSIPPPPKKPQTCYNCGRGGHRGAECKEASMEDLTKHTKIL